MTIPLLKKINFLIDDEEYRQLKKETDNFISFLKNAIKSTKIKADVFTGGSFAKKTMMKSESYDIDIFVRFERDNGISNELEKIIKMLKSNYIKIHGSRDYFQINSKTNKKITFEIIPVLKIKKAKDAVNTTDLSYFHVDYITRKLNDKLRNEISIAKKFFKANRVYGAESYISGFSGYSIECLIIHYKSFENMINAFQRMKENEKIIIDQEKQYKNKNEILIDINESKAKSPIILVDPTFKERNVLAALNNETFSKLREAINLFIKHPKIDYFEVKEINIEDMEKYAKKINGEFVKIRLETNRQEGDIAGTKLKKFSRFLIEEMSDYFNVIKDDFVYDLSKEADLYLIVKSRKEIIKQGPPISMKENVKAFKKANKKTFIKNEKIYSKAKINFNLKEFINRYAKENNSKLKEMDIVSLEAN